MDLVKEFKIKPADHEGDSNTNHCWSPWNNTENLDTKLEELEVQGRIKTAQTIAEMG